MLSRFLASITGRLKLLINEFGDGKETLRGRGLEEKIKRSANFQVKCRTPRWRYQTGSWIYPSKFQEKIWAITQAIRMYRVQKIMKLNETAEAVSVLRKKKFKDSALGLYLEFSEMRRKQ